MYLIVRRGSLVFWAHQIHDLSRGIVCFTRGYRTKITISALTHGPFATRPVAVPIKGKIARRSVRRWNLGVWVAGEMTGAQGVVSGICLKNVWNRLDLINNKMIYWRGDQILTVFRFFLYAALFSLIYVTFLQAHQDNWSILSQALRKYTISYCVDT